jgi:thiosulfate dehydrogenase [quinone] large subunit
MAFEKLKEFGYDKIVLVGLRLVLGWTMLWAFLDKTFGLGYATASDRAWINGGSPTTGYLSFVTSGVFADLWQGIAGNTVVDVLFMLGLLAIGVATILGIGMRLAAIGGALMMFLLYTTNIPPDNNPITDDHIINIFAFLLLGATKAGKYFGLGKWWASTKLVQKFPWLE